MMIIERLDVVLEAFSAASEDTLVSSRDICRLIHSYPQSLHVAILAGRFPKPDVVGVAPSPHMWKVSTLRKAMEVLK